MVGPTLDSDQRAGFFGRVNEQVDSVCSSLSAMPELFGGHDCRPPAGSQRAARRRDLELLTDNNNSNKKERRATSDDHRKQV